ncbi:hypothetical protein [Terrabacter terrae]|uniref:hypothetical protein n=1 Tax=Terrabacter terrae TaxID=318434 RepID=UPI0031D4EB72
MISLAVVLAFADGFWVISLRGAVGAIERTSEPFATWVRESAVMVPVYALAVLAALTLALRRFGSVLRGARAVVSSAWLVALAASVVGAGHLAVSSAVDFRLQSGLIEHMGSMSRTCGADCIARLQSDGFWLQARATGYGAALVLLTNVVVVVWMVAMRGGRLRVVSPRRGHASRVDDRVLGLAGALVGAAVIHLVVVPEHLAEWAAAGLFFLVLAVAQLVVAGAALVRPGRLSWLAAVVVSAGPVVLWAVSRTVGLPLGPEPGVPEALGIADLAGALLETAAVALALSLRSRPDRSVDAEGTHTHRTGLVVVALLAVTVVGVAGNGMLLLGGDPHAASTAQVEASSPGQG